jgi:hypothetical protein
MEDIAEAVRRSPLRAWDQCPGEGLGPGRLALVAARAGVGKTPFLVQAALDACLRSEPVVHVAVGETVDHVRAQYAALLRPFGERLGLPSSLPLRDAVDRLRLILAFHPTVFSPARLEQRLDELRDYGIPAPRSVVVDGLELIPDGRATAAALARTAAERGFSLWLAGRVHRDAGPLPDAVAPLLDLFDLALGLEAEVERVRIEVIKNPSGPEGPASVRIDPHTLLLIPADDG